MLPRHRALLGEIGKVAVMSMNEQQGTLGIIPLFCILSLGIGLMNHVMVVPPLIVTARRDAWLSVLIVIVPFLAWSTVLYGIMRLTGQQPLLPMLEHGWTPVLNGSLFVGGGLAELVVILLLQQELKKEIRLWKMWLLVFFSSFWCSARSPARSPNSALSRRPSRDTPHLRNGGWPPSG